MPVGEGADVTPPSLCQPPFSPVADRDLKNIKDSHALLMCRKPLFSAVFLIFCSFPLYQLSEFYFVRALMGNPFRFRFPYHGLILIGTGAGTVLCERTDINIIVQKASDGCVSPQPGILAAAISVMDRPVPAGRENPFLIQGGGDFPIGHAGLTHLEYLPHNSGGFPVNDQLVSVKNFYKIFTVLLQVLIPKAFPS